MVKDSQGHWDGVEVRVIRAIGEVLNFRSPQNLLLLSKSKSVEYSSFSRVNVQPPADGAKWGSIIAATGLSQKCTKLMIFENVYS